MTATEDFDEHALRDGWRRVCALLHVDRSDAKTAVGQWVDELDAEPSLPPSYTALPERFLTPLRRAADSTAGPHALRWLDLVLIELADRFTPRFERSGLPGPLLPEFRENLARMTRRAELGDGWARSTDDDIFLKDLGIARMTLLPCASHLIFRNAGVPRRLILQQEPVRLLSGLDFFMRRCGGFAPFLENHVHPAMLGHFNAQGRERCYQLVAHLLDHWPESRGLMGLSWYYDPAVARISPRLAYLHDVPLQAGALFLPAGKGRDVAAGAIATSPTRRRLYEAGDYVPTRYLMAWARQDLLRHVEGAEDGIGRRT